MFTPGDRDRSDPCSTPPGLGCSRGIFVRGFHPGFHPRLLMFNPCRVAIAPGAALADALAGPSYSNGLVRHSFADARFETFFGYHVHATSEELFQVRL